ncbi:MAG TPA: formate dehydrogenase accessory sulfurtransferase FdhD, partial [Candidatus Binataceae bacterium]|nr:formate dehydrogenase accessory sulfurtransferase FdhD [Candidatus Binataceae bacterium]
MTTKSVHLASGGIAINPHLIEEENPQATSKIVTRTTFKWRGGRLSQIEDALAAEEPLEIRLGGRPFTITMRTPGNDEELAAGFLLAEGFIANASELGEIRRVRDNKGAPEPNAIDIILNVDAERLRARLKRNFTMSSSCGICGKTSIESITRRVVRMRSRSKIAASTLLGLASTLRESQKVFAATGGLHACGLFDLEGNLIASREDIGRHNAVDKIVGWAIANARTPLSRYLLMVSGRLSFEIVQKA